MSELGNAYDSQHGESDFVDPAAHLGLLDQAKSVANEDFGPVGPSWYGPLMAFWITVHSLEFGFGGKVFSWTIDWLVFGLSWLGLALVVLHDQRSRKLRGAGRSVRGASLTVVLCVVMAIAAVAWRFAIETVGADRLIWRWATLGWLLTTVCYLAVQAVFHQRRRQLFGK